MSKKTNKTAQELKAERVEYCKANPKTCLFNKVIWIGAIVVVIVALTLPDNENKQDAKKEVIITLGDYKNLTENQKLDVIQNGTFEHKLDDILANDYYNCMGDFAYQKNKDLLYLDVLQWCTNEYKNNYQSFLSHINEYKIRLSANYSVGYNQDIENIKNKKKTQAIQLVKKKEKQDYLNRDKSLSVKKYKTIREVLANTLDSFNEEQNTLEIYNEKYFRLSPTYVDGTLKQVLLEDEMRAFIDGVFRTFIHSDKNEIKILIVPALIDYNPYKIKKFNQELAFTMTITREKAIRTAQILLKINSLDELVEVKKIGNDIYTPWSNTMQRARYNDQGNPTLNTFFSVLVKE